MRDLTQGALPGLEIEEPRRFWQPVSVSEHRMDRGLQLLTLPDVSAGAVEITDPRRI